MLDKRGNKKPTSRDHNRNMVFLGWADEPRNGLVSNLNATTTTTASSESPRASELFVVSNPTRVKLCASLCPCRHDVMQAWHQLFRPTKGGTHRYRFVAVNIAQALPQNAESHRARKLIEASFHRRKRSATALANARRVGPVVARKRRG
jgi:hypothetical protein